MHYITLTAQPILWYCSHAWHAPRNERFSVMSAVFNEIPWNIAIVSFLCTFSQYLNIFSTSPTTIKILLYIFADTVAILHIHGRTSNCNWTVNRPSFQCCQLSVKWLRICQIHANIKWTASVLEHLLVQTDVHLWNIIEIWHFKKIFHKIFHFPHETGRFLQIMAIKITKLSPQLFKLQ